MSDCVSVVCAGSQQGTQQDHWSCLLQSASAPAQVVATVTVTVVPGWSDMEVPLKPSTGTGQTEGTCRGRAAGHGGAHTAAAKKQGTVKTK